MKKHTKKPATRKAATTKPATKGKALRASDPTVATKAAKAIHDRLRQALDRDADRRADKTRAGRINRELQTPPAPVVPAPKKWVPRPAGYKPNPVAAPAAPTAPPVAPVAPPPVTPPINQAWRASIDWVAAGKKAYESKLRNLALRNAAAGGAPVPPPTPSPRRPAAPPRDVNDATEADYVTRLSAAIIRTIAKGDEARMVPIIGKDMGGGWIAVATDGHRALTRKVRAGEKVEPHGRMAITKAGRSQYWLTLTPALELTLRQMRQGVNKTAPCVTLTLDVKRKTATFTAAHLAPVATTVPVEGRFDKTGPTTLAFDVRFLVDALGRGGRFGWDRPTKKGLTTPPYVVEVSDQVRYVFMPFNKASR